VVTSALKAVTDIMEVGRSEQRKMREIVLDTETTGLDPLNGDRVIEIGAVELVNRFLTLSITHNFGPSNSPQFQIRQT